MQRHLETKRSKFDYFPAVLELGAGNMQHFLFVKHRFDTYIAADIREIPISTGGHGGHLDHN